MTGWTQLASLKQIVNFSQNIMILSLINVLWPAAVGSAFAHVTRVTQLLNLEAIGPSCFGAALNWDARFFVSPVERSPSAP